MNFSKQKPLHLIASITILILVFTGIVRAETNWSIVPKFPATGIATPFDGQWSGELKVKMIDCPTKISATAEVKFGFMVLELWFDGDRGFMWGLINENAKITGHISSSPFLNAKVDFKFTNDAVTGTWVEGHCRGTIELTRQNTLGAETESQSASKSMPTVKVLKKQTNEGKALSSSKDSKISTKSSISESGALVRQSDANSQYKLGEKYFKGDGVLQDYVYAHMWLNIAASQGNEKAIKLRDTVTTLMTPSQIAEAQKLARECVRNNYKGC